ncbi:hypothetical protein EBZ39_00370 [bacterium]|nr:hypothetical protein [bacterium]
MATRFADKDLLRQLNREAAARNYNRQIADEGIDRLANDAILAISPIIIHEHARGVAVAPHLRCSVQLVYPENIPWGGLMLDVPIELFEVLPTEQDLVKDPA